MPGALEALTIRDIAQAQVDDRPGPMRPTGRATAADAATLDDDGDGR